MDIRYILNQWKRHFKMISIGIVGIYVCFFLLPVITKINSYKHQIIDYSVKDKIYSRKVDDKNISDGLLLNMENNDEIAYNIKIISELVKIMVNKISFGTSCELDTKAGKLYAVPVDVDITGDLKNIISFVNNIENKSQMYELISFDINHNMELVKSINSGKLSLRYFYFGGK